MRLAATIVYVDDVPGTLQFYQEAFNLATRFVDVDVQLPGRLPGETYQFAELVTDGAALQLATPALGALLMPGFERSPTGAPAGVEVAFYTTDVVAAFDRAVRAGASAVRPPERMPWGQLVAYVRSREGTFVALCEPPGEASACRRDVVARGAAVCKGTITGGTARAPSRIDRGILVARA